MKLVGLLTISSLTVLTPAVAAIAQAAATTGTHAEPAASASGTKPLETSLELNEPASKGSAAFTPFIWVINTSGYVTIRDIKVDATVSFLDILDNTDRVFGLMGAVDVDYDRFVLQINGAWTEAKDKNSKSFLQNGTLDAEVTIENLWSELFVGYRILDQSMDASSSSKRRLHLDAFVGGRYTDIEVVTNLTARESLTLPDGTVLTDGQSRRFEQSEGWYECFVGTRLAMNLTDNWIVSLRGDVGGFGIDGSHFAWQFVGMLGYRWQFDGWTLTAGGGYRALGQDYSNGSFAWDVVTHGPILSATFGINF